MSRNGSSFGVDPMQEPSESSTSKTFGSFAGLPWSVMAMRSDDYSFVEDHRINDFFDSGCIDCPRCRSVYFEEVEDARHFDRGEFRQWFNCNQCGLQFIIVYKPVSLYLPGMGEFSRR